MNGCIKEAPPPPKATLEDLPPPEIPKKHGRPKNEKNEENKKAKVFRDSPEVL